MPIYTYRCTDCGASFEREESMSRHGADRPTCPECNNDHVEQRVTPFSVRTSKKS